MSRRLLTGGTWIDRSKPLRFTFDGGEYEGFEGDTLASALLANGIVGGFSSPIIGRPRGIYSAGVEEPNALVEISEPWFDPIVAATTVELAEGLVAEPRAGVGRLRHSVRAPRDRHAHRHVETLVIGAGVAGCLAAADAAADGSRVLLVEERVRTAADPSVGDEVTILTRTSALGIYDDGYVVLHERAIDVVNEETERAIEI